MNDPRFAKSATVTATSARLGSERPGQRRRQQDLERRAVALYCEGEISSGRAAELAGMSKDAFRHLLTRKRISVLDATAEELARDVAAAGEALRQNRESSPMPDR